jgi:hypothetical protein
LFVLISGGKYIPLVNAERILSNVIEYVVIVQLMTFRQAFDCVIGKKIEKNSLFKYSDVKSRVDGMMQECETIADIRQSFY